MGPSNTIKLRKRERKKTTHTYTHKHTQTPAKENGKLKLKNQRLLLYTYVFVFLLDFGDDLKLIYTVWIERQYYLKIGISTLHFYKPQVNYGLEEKLHKTKKNGLSFNFPTFMLCSSKIPVLNNINHQQRARMFSLQILQRLEIELIHLCFFHLFCSFFFL
ncbi:conserved hypothetical protein [Lodderomyces elongisporus NRRL YB-4239]|uniref:Uncharacterized protein n=1 Tax=Lodderomyces elongisporus (strain ATCC 11503 / CBS 2605 / JCM 1781 / NBRC 1676 / NRRL YB-4239) TaxID=379508 RepID=A5E538_LODEL|nr:conserved hypothetical protein [Lodderomyces elongisporus NRRL YB-4239]